MTKFQYKILFKSLLIFFLTTTPLVTLGIELKTVAQDSPPKYYLIQKNNKYEMAGLCIDIMRAIEKVVPDIKFVGQDVFYPTARIFKYLETGKIDVYIGAGSNKEREAKNTYLDIPLYAVNHVVAVRIDDSVNVSSFNDIKALGWNGRLVTLFGTGTHRFLLQQQGLKITTQSTLSEVIKQLLLKRKKARARFAYYHDIGLKHAVRTKNFKGKIKILPVSFRKYHHYIAFSKAVPKAVIKKVKAAIEQLAHNGELARLHKKYL